MKIFICTCWFLNICFLLLPHNFYFLSDLWKVLRILTFLKSFNFKNITDPSSVYPTCFPPFFSMSLQKNYSHTAPEMWICVWVKNPVLDWRRSYTHMLCSPYQEFLLIKLQKLCLHALNFPSPLYLLPCHNISSHSKHTQIQIKHKSLFWHLPSW